MNLRYTTTKIMQISVIICLIFSQLTLSINNSSEFGLNKIQSAKINLGDLAELTIPESVDLGNLTEEMKHPIQDYGQLSNYISQPISQKGNILNQTIDSFNNLGNISKCC